MEYFMQFILFLVLIILTLTLEYSQLVDPLNEHQNLCSDIRNGQFICRDCGTLGFCMQRNGAWTMLKITDCQTQHNMYCDAEARGCVFKQTCEEGKRGPKFECQNPGIFPDPYECKYYHVCNSKNEGELLICPGGSTYSPITKTCSGLPSTAICLEPQYECQKLGYMAAWPTDPSIYYICYVENVGGHEIRYPVLYSCQRGYFFVNNKCSPRTSHTAIESLATTAVPVIKTCVPGNDLIPNLYDCYSYFVCINKLLVPTKCPIGTRFSLATKSCVFGKC